jgi:chorismate dehydratase
MKNKIKPIKVVAVSYLNTLPFIYGLEQYKPGLLPIELDLQIPAMCAKKIKDNKAEVGLVPVGALKNIENYEIISDFCIGAEQMVKSVLLLSDVPLSEIERIYLDYQSATSVRLVQVLAREFWKITPEFIPSYPGFEQAISGKTAGVLIGDRTFNLPKEFNYTFDLADNWYQFTKLPFVFACWISIKPLEAEFKEEFNNALKLGVSNIDKVLEFYADRVDQNINLKDYYENCISYSFDEQKKQGLQKFLNYL